MGAHLRRRVLLLAVAAAVAVALPSSVRADEPLRSGTITGWGYTWPAMHSGEVRNCQWDEVPNLLGSLNAECRVWLDSGCDPHLAGREPAVTASIQEVSDLADGVTSRTFEWDAAGTREADLGGVVVQLWTGDCTEVRGSEWRSLDRLGQFCCTWIQHKSTTLVIPPTARWMTVTTNDTVGVEWTLS